MGLRAVADLMRADVMSAHNARTFQAARSFCSELQPFEDVATLLAIIRDRGEEGARRRDRLTRVIIELHRATGLRLWSSLLIILYYPLICRIRVGLAGGRLSGEDLDQIVMCSFLATISSLDIEKMRNIAVGLQQRTRRRVFESIGKEFRYESSAISMSDEPYAADTVHERTNKETARSGSFPNSVENDTINAVHLSVFLSRASEEGVNTSALDEVLSATKADSLRCFCERHGGTERSYQRMKRQRTRVMQRLRDIATTTVEG